MDDIAFIYERFISISIRGNFNIDNESFKGIKICLNPNFWPHSFNFKRVSYKKCKVNKTFSPLDKKWEKSLKMINYKLSQPELAIKDKKNIFIEWVKNNNELWEKVRNSGKINDHYIVKFSAWSSFISFINKYNAKKSNIINDKNIFNIYKINEVRSRLNYNSDYILRIKDLHNSKKENYILLFCVKSSFNDLNIKLVNNPTKNKNKVNYLYLTLKSLQLRDNYHFDKCKEMKFTNIFLNERTK